jgi:type II secretory pathway component PulJ
MRSERGVALLEVVAALVIVAMAGLSLISLTAEGLRATVAAATRERELADTERLLAAYSLLTRNELDQRLGDRTVGRYVVDVQRPERALYRIALDNLVTVVYRPDLNDAP